MNLFEIAKEYSEANNSKNDR